MDTFILFVRYSSDLSILMTGTSLKVLYYDSSCEIRCIMLLFDVLILQLVCNYLHGLIIFRNAAIEGESIQILYIFQFRTLFFFVPYRALVRKRRCTEYGISSPTNQILKIYKKI